MHSDLSPHLHTPECNQLINLLKKCHEENQFAKFIGVCNTFDQQVVNCLRKERQDQSRRNREQAKAKQLLVQERMRKFDEEKS
ncbi:COX assembly mitochondrial protein 2 homolog [Uranotaenia lowii]|uniref:COX assembly mitochondrial protein 2 homolog n=1 Tax=Uranotaenia lowii TaxID=190385 RepID=UPI00247A9096|nr:COX assembly mitochondrial protein 2 homolog [Uranotaenia lowii]XP_055587785.1 COX assembly mitochondrial protein 2 homolog [Uranotaenia lowii]